MGEESSRDDEQIGEEREGKGNKEKEREGKTLWLGVFPNHINLH